MNVLVIGTDKGLGKILSKMLVDAGHKVAAGYYDLKNADPELAGLKLQMDVSSEAQLAAAAEEIKAQMGELDAVIDVAGILPQADRDCTLLDEPADIILAQLQVNALGVLLAFRNIKPIMKKGSRFYAVTSEGGSFTLAGTLFPAYSVSKTAANKFVQVIRLTLKAQGDDSVDVIAVHPGRMNTEMGRTTAQIEPEVAAEGFIKLVEGKTPVNSDENWFINYKGEPMPV